MSTINIEEEDRTEEKEENIHNKLVNHIYSLYYELMRDRNVSTIFASIMFLIMAVQMLALIYDKRADYPFMDKWYLTISTVIAAFRIYPAIEDSDNVTFYWVAQYFFFGLLIFYIVQAFYIEYCLSIARLHARLSVKILQFLSSVLFWVSYVPMIENFVSIYSCKDGYHIIDTSLECWTGIHIFYCIFFTFALLLTVLIVFIISVFYNESRANVKDGLRRLDASLEVQIVFYRLVITIVAHFVSNQGYKWLLPLATTFASFYFVMYYWTHITFYEPLVSIINGIYVCSYFWISFNILLMVLLKGTAYTGQSIIIVIGIIIIIPLVRNIRNWRIQQVLFGSQFDKIRNDYELDIYMKKLLDLLENSKQSKADELILLGYMNNHKAECRELKCPLLQETLYFAGEECSTQNTTLSNPVIVLSLMASIYRNYVKSPNFKSVLHISFSQFCFVHMKNIHLAVIELDIAKKMSPSFQELFTIYRNKRIIEEDLIVKYNNKVSDDIGNKSFHNLDITIVLKFESLLAKLSKAIEKATNEHIEFWSQLDSLLPDLNILHKLGLNITNFNKQNDEIWKKLHKINSNHKKTLRDYGRYLRDIQNDNEKGSEYIRKGGGTNSNSPINDHRNDFSIMFAEDTAIIVMSAGNKENQGKIIKTNAGLFNIFKYKPLEVIGYDVTLLMPKGIGEYHNEFLEDFFRTGKEKVINTERELYAISRDGNLICISALVKLVPSLKDDIQYIALITQHKKDNNFILMNAVGRIDSMSTQLMGLLNMQQSFLKDNEVYVQFLFPELITLEEGKDNTLGTLFERFEGKLDMTFMIPKDLPAKIQDFSKNSNVSSKERNPEASKELLRDELNEGKTKFPKSVKEIARFIYGSEFCEDTVRSVKNIVMKKLDYEQNERKEKWRVKIKHLNYGNGKCQMKVFRISKTTLSADLMSEVLYDIKDNLKRSTPHQSRNISKSTGKMKLGFSTKRYSEIKDTMEKEEKEHAKEGFTPKLTQMEEDDNKNEISGDLDVSQVERIPLKENTSIVWEWQKFYLQKEKEKLPEEEEVINNLLKGDPMKKQNKGEANDKVANDNKMVVNKEECNSGSFTGETNSVASDTKSLKKCIRSLRNAVYEEYCPYSVQQLKHVGRFVVLALLLISLLYYLITRTLYKNLKTNVTNIKHVRDRYTYIVSMGGCTRSLMLLNPKNGMINGMNREGNDYHLDGFEGNEIIDISSMNYEEWTFNCIEQSSKSVKEAQNGISTSNYEFSENKQERINPSSVRITYKEESQVEGSFNLDCWSAIMALVIHGLKIKDISLINILPENPSIYYIMENSFNNILEAISLSVKYMEKETENKINSNIRTIMILLIVASVSIAISVLIILRVTIMVSNNKEAILKLFMDLPSQSVKEQLGICRSYFSTLRDSDKVDLEEKRLDTEQVEEKKDELKVSTNEEEKAKNKDDAEQSADDDEEKAIVYKVQIHKEKKYKPYSKNILLMIIEFSFFTLVFEGYFVIIFIRSSYFLSNLMRLMSEFVITSSQSYSNGLLYQAFQDCAATHGTSYIMRINSELFLQNLLTELIIDQEHFLKLHSDHRKLNSEAYNDMFDTLVYGNICEYMFKDNIEDCNKYIVLTQGLHSSYIEHLDGIRKFINIYETSKLSSDSAEIIKDLINSPNVVRNERMTKRYFTRVYKKLLDHMKEDLYDTIDREGVVIMVCFVVFVVFLAIYYVVLWRLFVESTRNSLWVTKCMLGIIPVQTLVNVPNIKNFLVDSSKGLMMNLG